MLTFTPCVGPLNGRDVKPKMYNALMLTFTPRSFHLTPKLFTIFSSRGLRISNLKREARKEGTFNMIDNMDDVGDVTILAKLEFHSYQYSY